MKESTLKKEEKFKRVLVTFSDEDLEQVDSAANYDSRTRSSFLRSCAIKQARKLLDGNNGY